MDIKPIKNEADYQEALQEIESLFDVSLNTPQGQKLDILTTLVEVYEQQHYPIESPSPIEAILYHLESRNQGFSTLIEGLKRRGVSEEIIHDSLQDFVDISEV